MNSLFFWIIVCSWLIPLGIRMYRRSQQRRINNSGYPDGRFQQGGYPGRLPDYVSGQYPPGQYPPSPYPGQPSQPEPPAPYHAPATPPSSSIPVPAPSEPQGFRARKLAELDRQFSDGKIAMEEYMKLRQEIMNG
ncbi:hypothetical protein BIU82_12550 [Arthrobacter sp. SW1]|uniref:hypothetical protein n=1 Tax=Arthrobacter sp. SW1 TaxID=1920889 RepID=UPI000877BCF0|nr:hypothetical protein [Arthrobacter sp. SW1]OFI36593.1 hypothetical protein BIU82_12550 [Arthrobacter sp. SW1]